MNSWWQLWQGAFNPETCDSIIKDALALSPVQATVGHGGTSLVDRKIRRSVVRWIPWNWQWLRREIDYYFHEANAKAFGFDLATCREVQFTEYDGSDAGEYRAHTDLTWKNTTPYDRKLSLVIQLSDPKDYDGCDLILAEEPPETADLRTRGSVVVFPSFLQHGVTTCTRGKRYSLVAWFEGPKFR